jgi:hypothetical protein
MDHQFPGCEGYPETVLGDRAVLQDIHLTDVVMRQNAGKMSGL